MCSQSYGHWGDHILSYIVPPIFRLLVGLYGKVFLPKKSLQTNYVCGSLETLLKEPPRLIFYFFVKRKTDNRKTD